MERVRSLVDKRLRSSVRLACRTTADGTYVLTVVDSRSSVPRLWVYLRGGQVHITDEGAVSEESDDLDVETDRAVWASETVADLAQFGAARVSDRKLGMRSHNRLQIFTAAGQRLGLDNERVVSEFLPFARE